MMEAPCAVRHRLPHDLRAAPGNPVELSSKYPDWQLGVY